MCIHVHDIVTIMATAVQWAYSCTKPTLHMTWWPLPILTLSIMQSVQYMYMCIIWSVGIAYTCMKISAWFEVFVALVKHSEAQFFTVWLSFSGIWRLKYAYLILLCWQTNGQNLLFYPLCMHIHPLSAPIEQELLIRTIACMCVPTSDVTYMYASLLFHNLMLASW